MIEKSLIFLRNRINTYLKLKTGEDNKINLTNLTDENGKTIIKDLGLSLVNVEEERVFKNQNPPVKNANGTFSVVNPEVSLNLFILISANFGNKETDYRESLKFLSHVVTFFQSRTLFTPMNSPELDPGIQKLVIELQNISFEAQNNLWASLGAKYMPSVLYKLRMITMQEMEVKMEAPPVTEANLYD
jgi:hypothetical protein